MRRTAAVLLLTVLAAAGCSSSDDGDSDDKPAARKPSPTADPGGKFIQSVLDAHLDSYARGVPRPTS